MKFYNTISNQKEEFTPLDPQHIRMYACGPTVYDRVHIGNARPAVIFDVLYRLLHFKYPQVTYVRNITDVDDKINTRAQEMGVPIHKLTEETTIYYHQDMAALNVLTPDIEPRATQHIPEMIDMIQKLIAYNLAYVADGHVLFAVREDPYYGHLSKRNRDDMIAGARVEIAPYKKDPADFVLWKPSEEGIPGWESPWGFGRPGWHIECSAMSTKYLGSTFDIHCGGQDLIFPHHENEIAQSCGVHGHGTFAKYWLHNGLITVNGEKMSKSLGNFLTVREALDRYPGELVRFILLSTHYRQALDWNITLVEQARSALDRLYTSLRDSTMESQASPSQDVMNALEDDMNTPLAISKLFEMSSAINKASDSQEKLALQATLRASGQSMGILMLDAEAWFKSGTQASGLSEVEIETLIQARETARQSRNFAESDRIRDELLEHGILLEDAAAGTTWRRK